MELELHQLDRRYEGLRKLAPGHEARLLASLSLRGQQAPVVVVTVGGDLHVLVDGYKRVRALAKLRQDTVLATSWTLPEQEALLLERMMRAGDVVSALEEGWLLSELRDRFRMAPAEMARRFDKSESWVSRRLALVVELPHEVQEHVRRGDLQAHSAMKYLVPLARANRDECVQLAALLAAHRPSTRQVAAVYMAWLSGDERERALLLQDPGLFLRARAEAKAPDPTPKKPSEVLLSELGALCGIASRAHRRVRDGGAQGLNDDEHAALRGSLVAARASAELLFVSCHKELARAQRDDAVRDPAPA